MPVDSPYPFRGFSPTDLNLLAELQNHHARQGSWVRAQLVQDGPADYLAVWESDSDEQDPPSLAIARFKRTGTYAVTRGEYLVTTGRTLRDVVAAFGSAAVVFLPPSDAPPSRPN
jgi:hypothetical protein